MYFYKQSGLIPFIYTTYMSVIVIILSITIPFYYKLRKILTTLNLLILINVIRTKENYLKVFAGLSYCLKCQNGMLTNKYCYSRLYHVQYMYFIVDITLKMRQ